MKVRPSKKCSSIWSASAGLKSVMMSRVPSLTPLSPGRKKKEYGAGASAQHVDAGHPAVELVVAVAAVEDIVALVAGQGVVAALAVDNVVAAAALKDIEPRPAEDRIVAAFAVHTVSAATGAQHVGAVDASDLVLAVASGDILDVREQIPAQGLRPCIVVDIDHDVVRRGEERGVVAGPAEQLTVAGAAVQDVVAMKAVDEVVAAQGEQEVGGRGATEHVVAVGAVLDGHGLVSQGWSEPPDGTAWREQGLSTRLWLFLPVPQSRKSPAAKLTIPASFDLQLGT